MSRKIAKFGPKKSLKRPFYTVKMDRHYFWDAPFRTIPKLVLLLLKWYSNYDSSPCNALLRTFFIWSTYECFYDTKMTKKGKNLIFLRYNHITPIFWAQIDSTQWDDTFPISWGNFGYLWFSSRWPFGRLVGRSVAPIAQSGPFGVQKCCFWPETFFCGHPCKGVNTKMLSFWCPVMVVTNKVGQFPKKNGFLAKELHFWPEILRFFTLQLWNPHFFGSDGTDSMGS